MAAHGSPRCYHDGIKHDVYAGDTQQVLIVQLLGPYGTVP